MKKLDLSGERILEIELEEHARHLIRRDLEKASTSTPTRWSRLWHFSNSNVGMFVLSSIVLAGIVNFISGVQAQAAQARDDRTQAIRVLAELDYRLIQVDYWITQLPVYNGTGPEVYIWRIVIGDPAYRATLPEFKESHIYGLVHRLELLTGVNATEARKAAIDLENVGRPDWTYSAHDIRPIIATMKLFRSKIARRLADST